MHFFYIFQLGLTCISCIQIMKKNLLLGKNVYKSPLTRNKPMSFQKNFKKSIVKPSIPGLVLFDIFSKHLTFLFRSDSPQWTAGHFPVLWEYENLQEYTKVTVSVSFFL